MSDSPAILFEPPNYLVWRGKRYHCALGRGGLNSDKVEGDGTTPTGRFPLRRLLYRPDRLTKPKTKLAIRAIQLHDGWCDDPSHKAYNQLITLPFSGRHEYLWREDHIYDLLVVLGYNDAPVIAKKGSAIFMHVAKPAYSPTEGCIALPQKDLLEVLKTCGPETYLIIPKTL